MTQRLELYTWDGPEPSPLPIVIVPVEGDGYPIRVGRGASVADALDHLVESPYQWGASLGGWDALVWHLESLGEANLYSHRGFWRGHAETL